MGRKKRTKKNSGGAERVVEKNNINHMQGKKFWASFAYHAPLSCPKGCSPPCFFTHGKSKSSADKTFYDGAFSCRERGVTTFIV